MAKDPVTTRAPRGTKTVARAFFTAADEIAEAYRPKVIKAALAFIRDELKVRREKATIAKARAPAKKAAAAKPVAKVAKAKPVKATMKAKPAKAMVQKRGRKTRTSEVTPLLASETASQVPEADTED
jgi:hypothetical protein